MFRRGFKTWAEQTSGRVRQKLKLASSAPVDPSQLAEMLRVVVISPEDLGELADDVRRRLLNDHGDNWSAITVTDGQTHLVVENSSHSASRRHSNLAHELAHIILGHEPSMMFMSPNSGLALRTYNDDQEQEADWLAACLLLPRDALLAIRRRGLSDEEACSLYGVSPAMLRFRFNISGVDVQLRRAQRTKR